MKFSLFKNKETTITDAELVTQCRDGVRSSQKKLYEKCRAQFMQYQSGYKGIQEEVKMDIFQDAYIILWEKIERGDVTTSLGKVMVKRKDGVGQCDDLMAFFMRIARNKYHEQLRRAGHEIPMTDSLERSELTSNIPLYDDSPEMMRLRMVDQCVKELPKHCVEILTLFYYDKKSLDEILEERMQNSTKNGLKNSKSKCLTKLKENIRERMRTYRA